MGDKVSRTTAEDGSRVYNEAGAAVPSVTTVLNEYDADTSGLKYWKKQNDGRGDNADHELLFWYSRHRGTLSHSAALSTVTDKTLWSGDERSSLRAIEERAHDVDTIYSVAKSHEPERIGLESWDEFAEWREEFGTNGTDATLMDLLWNDVNYVKEQFAAIADTLGITPDSTIFVEEKFVEDDACAHHSVPQNCDRWPHNCRPVGYGGQLDLAYEDPDGNTVVADLKTSSSCRYKHQMQASAYGHALSPDFDRLEVIRISPKKGTFDVHSHETPTDLHTTDVGYRETWTETPTQLFDEFTDLARAHPLNK